MLIKRMTYLQVYLTFICPLLVNSFSRKSDPTVDAENMANSPNVDPSMIPLDLVMLDNPAMMDDMPGDPLNPQDFKQAATLNTMPFDASILDPIMIAELFQGDIRLTSQDILFDLTAHTAALNDNTISMRNAIIDPNKKWKDGVIPYVISSKFSTDERAWIAKAMQAYHQHTCIRFKSRTNQKDYVHIKKGNGCSSSVGRTGGMQTVSLGSGCVYHGIIIHEFMHAVGFWHEQSRADRDNYITMVWSNIQDGMEYNFQKYDWNIIQNLGITYDTGSIMHYGPKSFAIDRRKNTIIANNGETIGQRNNFSKKDKTKINLLYECNIDGGTVVPKPTTPKPPPPIPVPDKCVDSNIHCEYWKKIGECETNPSWMNPNCMKSCKQCGTCKDVQDQCLEWARSDQCTYHSDYMHVHCKASCGLCGKGKGIVAKKCEDENVYCSDWAMIGECDINPGYMKEKCRKSCKVC